MGTNHTIKIRGEIIDLSTPKVMGIINVTPDSFYEESRKMKSEELFKSAERMLEEGVDFLDVGGYSSRPGADEISIEEELDRVCNAVRIIVERFPEAIVSTDTFRSQVAREAIRTGATIINDISGGHLDDEMFSTVAELNVPYIAMHMRGTPQNMMELTDYTDLIREITFYFSGIINQCNQLGIHDLILDPGFGFSKTREQNFHLLRHLEHFQILDKPILAGLSRKSMIYRSLNLTANEALNGTTTLNTLALFKGACILRVHDVKEAVEVVKLVNQLS
ncbi:MAG: dihydropteroate synthase [Cyclobacteriaceae bacterium]